LLFNASVDKMHNKMNDWIQPIISCFLTKIGVGRGILGFARGMGRRLAHQAAGLGRQGQASVEYAIVAGILTAIVAILAVFLYTFREYGGRVLDLVSADYP
jgi:hypothetical protein